MGAPNRGGVVSTNISLYLKNSARYGHRYYGMLIETCMCSIIYLVIYLVGHPNHGDDRG